SEAVRSRSARWESPPRAPADAAIAPSPLPPRGTTRRPGTSPAAKPSRRSSREKRRHSTQSRRGAEEGRRKRKESHGRQGRGYHSFFLICLLLSSAPLRLCVNWLPF